MRSHPRVSLLGAALALTLAAACGPSIDQAAKADIDRRLASLSASGQSFTPPTTFEPMPLGPGQWAEYKAIDGDGKPSFMKMKIVGQDADAYWFEIESQTYQGRSAMLYLMRIGDRRNPDSIEIRAVRQMDKDGDVQVFPPEMIAMMQSMYRSGLTMLTVTWENQPQEDAAVPAGSFAACFKVRSEVSVMGFRSSSMTWSHPLVPLSGMVRSQGLDNPGTMELVAFGTTGARSVFPGM